jgi:hypothetical protein
MKRHKAKNIANNILFEFPVSFLSQVSESASLYAATSSKVLKRDQELKRNRLR